MSIKITRQSALFSIIAFCIVFFRVSSTSLIYREHPGLSFLTKAALMLCMVCFVLIVFESHFDKKEIGIICFFAIITLAVYFHTRDKDIFFLTILMIPAAHQKIEYIIKVIMNSLIFNVLLIVLLCAVGFISDYTYSRPTGIMAHTLGFSYYSFLPIYVLSICMMWMYIHRTTKKSILFWFAVLALATIASTKKLTFLFGVIYFAYYFCVDVLKIKRVYLKKIRTLGIKKIMLYSVFPLLIIGFALASINLYRWNLDIFNQLSHRRLFYSYTAFQQYGIALFGNQIEMYGGDALRFIEHYENFYIDSGLLVLLLQQGVVYLACIFWIYTTVLRGAIKMKNDRLIFWIIIVLLYNIGGDTIIDVWYNPIPLLVLPTYRFLRQKQRSNLYLKGKKLVYHG